MNILEGPIESIILVCDVDGVVRKSTEDDIDLRVVEALKELIHVHNVDVAFISGTPVAQNPLLESWRKGNSTLDKCLGRYFLEELREHKVAIYGALGGQRMTPDGDAEILEAYSQEIIFEICNLLIQAFVIEVEHDGSDAHKKSVYELKKLLDEVRLKDIKQPVNATPKEFGDLVAKIQTEIDPSFKLVSYGSFVESHTSNPPWKTHRSFDWLNAQLESSNLEISKMDEDFRHVAHGLAYRGQDGYNFLMISKTNKSFTIQKHLQNRLHNYPKALIVTIGDTQVDFPMHQHANVAFHVGLEHVWKSHNLSHCHLVRNHAGKDEQHVEGTLQVLKNLKTALGKSLCAIGSKA